VGRSNPSLRIRTWTDLILINLLVLILIIVILCFPSNVIRVILAVPFLLFFPGYILTAALYPRKESVDNVKRAALSFGLSIAVVPLVGLILNYTVWGITLESVLSSVSVFIVIMSVITLIRRRQLPGGERFGTGFRLSMPGWRGNIWDKALTVLLVLLMLGAMAAVGYTIAASVDGEKFTEFYILGEYGETPEYRQSVTVGHEVEVTVGIVNRESEEVSYQLVIVLDGVRKTEVGPIVLAADEKWEQVVGVTPDKPGSKQKVEFFLYMNGETNQYRGPLCIWIDVIE
jgi:uncharacterized membrane protein